MQTARGPVGFNIRSNKQIDEANLALRWKKIALKKKKEKKSKLEHVLIRFKSNAFIQISRFCNLLADMKLKCFFKFRTKYAA